MRTLRKISIFERSIAVCAAGIFFAVSVVVLAGDHVGVQVERYGPSGASSQSSIVTVQFSERMDRGSVEERFSVLPELPGEVSWNGSRLIFRPLGRFEPETTYQVVITGGAKSDSGRELLEDFSFNFTVRGARVVYLKLEEDGSTQNLWLADPASDEPPERLTDFENGVFQYDVSPDGSRLVFTDQGGSESEGTSQFMLLDLQSRETTQLTFLPDTYLNDPAWNFDGTKIAYTRIDTGWSVPGIDPAAVGGRLPRVWVLDISQDPPSNMRLLPPDTGASFEPAWSPTQDVVGVGLDPLVAGQQRRLVLAKQEEGQLFQVDTSVENSITYSIDGDEFLILVRVSNSFQAPTEIWRVGINSGQLQQVQNTDAGTTSVRDVELAWQPGQPIVAVIRTAIDGVEGKTSDLYLVDFQTGATTPVLVDDVFNIHGVEWSPSGKLLAIDRFRRFNPDGSNATGSVREVVTYDPDTGSMKVLDTDALDPQWLP